MKAGSYYFICSSACNGWNPCQQKYTYSTSMNSGWNTTWTNIGDSVGYQSQTNFLLPVTGSGTTSYIYMGDRWNSSTLGDSRYVWLPLTVSVHALSMSWTANWTVNASTGTITNNLPGPWYKIVGVQSSKVLDVVSNSTADAANVDLWTSNGGYNQNWALITVGSHTELVNRWSGLAMEVSGASTANGGNVDQYTYSGGTHQLWDLTIVSGSKYKITNVNSGKVVDVTNQSTSDGANIEQYTYNGGNNQLWTLTTVS